MTNIDWYEVVDVKPRSVLLRKLAAEVKETGFMSGLTKPVKGRYTSGPFLKPVRLSIWNGKPHYSIPMKFGSACKWDGNEVYCSWYS